MCVLRNIQENVPTEEKKRAAGNNLTHKQVESFINLHVKLLKLSSKFRDLSEKVKVCEQEIRI